ncbi:hypothetical protein CRG98_050253 [Punica granatum]|uniref:Uncharacterized protein n=1 Tax=Punica granatum TaxID=22663 RepID=A0A2I0GK18_PUNGR|nr:hypothetical protein CRG98_050253 [Punica granatum]
MEPPKEGRVRGVGVEKRELPALSLQGIQIACNSALNIAESDLRKPLFDYLHDPNVKANYCERTLGYILIDEFLYKYGSDGLLLRCISPMKPSIIGRRSSGFASSKLRDANHVKSTLPYIEFRLPNCTLLSSHGRSENGLATQSTKSIMHLQRGIALSS